MSERLTVGELVEILDGLPPEMEVVVFDSEADAGFWYAEDVEVVMLREATMPSESDYRIGLSHPSSADQYKEAKDCVWISA